MHGRVYSAADRLAAVAIVGGVGLVLAVAGWLERRRTRRLLSTRAHGLHSHGAERAAPRMPLLSPADAGRVLATQDRSGVLAVAEETDEIDLVGLAEYTGVNGLR